MTTRTITVNSTPGDATSAAKEVAERLRAQGHIVTIGAEYTQTRGHKAGQLSVDMTIEEPQAEETKTTTEASAVTAVAFVPERVVENDLTQDAVTEDGEFNVQVRTQGAIDQERKRRREERKTKREEASVGGGL